MVFRHIGHYRSVLIGIMLAALIGVLVVRSGWAAEEAVNAVYYDNPVATYTGAWTHASGWSRAYNNTISWTNSPGAKEVLNFTGSSITRLYSMTFNRGSANIYIDGTYYGATNDYAVNTRWQVAKTWNFPYGYHVIEVRQNGGGYTDADAFIVDIPTVGNGAYDNTNSQIKYIGTWAATATGWTAAYGGSLRWTNTAEDAASFTFTGDSVTYIYTKSTNRGFAAVTIDGVDKGMLDLYASAAQFQQGTTYSGLGGGIHTVHVSVPTNQKNAASSGYYIDVDAFKVGSVYNRTAAVSYADTWAHGRNNSNYPNYGNNGDNPCNDCTNYLSQVLEAGGMPRIESPGASIDNQYYWYIWWDLIAGWRGSKSWAATPDFKTHADTFQSRYQFIGTTTSAVTSLSAGDFVIFDLASQPVIGPDHVSIIVGMGYPQEGDQTNQWLLLRDAHCNDRKRVRWNYGLVPEDKIIGAYHVIY